MPLLLIQSGPDAAASADGGGGSHPPSADAGAVGAASLASDVNAGGAASGSTAAPSTTVPAVTTPPTTAPVETTLPAQNVASHAIVAPTTTTTTRPPPPPTTTTTAPALQAPAPVSGSVHYGQVTYYDHPAGRCASPFLPFGTVVRITNPANGLSISCTVDDREADTARSIDLATSTFALLAPLSQGVINAELTW